MAANGPAPNGARPSAGTVLPLHISFKASMAVDQFVKQFGPDDILQVFNNIYIFIVMISKLVWVLGEYHAKLCVSSILFC